MHCRCSETGGGEVMMSDLGFHTSLAFGTAFTFLRFAKYGTSCLFEGALKGIFSNSVVIMNLRLMLAKINEQFQLTFFATISIHTVWRSCSEEGMVTAKGYNGSITCPKNACKVSSFCFPFFSTLRERSARSLLPTATTLTLRGQLGVTRGRRTLS
jgi:hypothetical protein